MHRNVFFPDPTDGTFSVEDMDDMALYLVEGDSSESNSSATSAASSYPVPSR